MSPQYTNVIVQQLSLQYALRLEMMYILNTGSFFDSDIMLLVSYCCRQLKKLRAASQQDYIFCNFFVHFAVVK